MRFKYLKYLAFVLGGLSTVIATGALYLYATFDGARLAAELTHFAKQRYQRVLKFDGPLELSMFPRLALHLPALSLSGKKRRRRIHRRRTGHRQRAPVAAAGPPGGGGPD